MLHDSVNRLIGLRTGKYKYIAAPDNPLVAQEVYDLDMKAIANRWSIEETVVKALRAGCDGFLICNGDYDKKVRALEALIREAEADRAFETRVLDAMARMRRPKLRFLAGRRPSIRPDRLDALAPLEHQMVAEEMRQWL